MQARCTICFPTSAIEGFWAVCLNVIKNCIQAILFWCMIKKIFCFFKCAWSDSKPVLSWWNCIQGNIRECLRDGMQCIHLSSSSSSSSSHLSLTTKVVGAPQMILQPVSSFFPVLHCPLGLAELQACPFPDVVYSVCLVFPLSLCLARWFWPHLMNGRCDNTTSVCISLQWSGGLHVVQLPAGSWHRFPHW